MLTTIICLPLLAAILVALMPRTFRFGVRLVALTAMLLTLAVSVVMFLRFDSGETGYQFETTVAWVESLGINYHVGVDGLNVGLMLMAALVGFAACCASWEIRKLEKEFYLLLLVMSGGILGAFASLDLFFFYFFHEVALVPTFIMIGVWGRGENRNYATFKMTLYLSAGALIGLIGLIAMYLQMPTEARTFDMVELAAWFEANPMESKAQYYIFPLLMFGFGILVSLWPFHTWAPLGYAAAPTPTAMLHAGVLKKFGLYGLIRIALPVMPEGAANWLPVLAWLCVGNILYCGLVAMRQKDLNLLIGNSSVAHMGFVFLGVASYSLIGVTGAVLVMVAHGLLAAVSFGLSGYIYHQTGTLDMSQMGGLIKRLPFIGMLLMMAALAGCGLPGFANFAGEVLILFGAWDSLPWFVVVAAWGALVIGAVYMMRAIRQILHGPLAEQWNVVRDADHWRGVPFVLLMTGLLVFGFVPGLLTDKIKPSAEGIVRQSPNAEVRISDVEGVTPNAERQTSNAKRSVTDGMVAGIRPERGQR